MPGLDGKLLEMVDLPVVVTSPDNADHASLLHGAPTAPRVTVSRLEEILGLIRQLADAASGRRRACVR